MLRRVLKATSEKLVLGLESSADDTCAAVVSSSRRILSNVVIKQSQLHEQWGGIQPLLAQEAHSRNMPVAISRALKEAGVGLADLDGVAFTRGPGMYGCLSVCSGAGKALAAAAGLPALGVHHMQAHALTPFLTEENPPEFPFLTLLLSGGHTLLLLARSETSFKILATTHDESIGASFDKACRDLRIPWALGAGSPGAALEAFAFPPSPPASPPPSPPSSILPSPKFTLPFRKQLAFSYAGLRSALSRILKDEPAETMSDERKRLLSAEFIKSAVAQIEEKVELGIKGFEDGEVGKAVEEKLGGLVVSGGVASNMFLRSRLRTKLDQLGYDQMRLIFPPPHLCTDNAAMIAQVGLSRLRRERIDDPGVMPIAKWSIEECEEEFENVP